MKFVPTLIVSGAVAVAGFLSNQAQGAVTTTLRNDASLVGKLPDVNFSAELINYTITANVAALDATLSGGSGLLTLPGGTFTSVTNEALTLHIDFTRTAAGQPFSATGGSVDVSGNLGAAHHDFFDSSSLLIFGYTESAQQPQSFEFQFAPGTGDYGSGKFFVFLHSPINTAAGVPVVPNNNFDSAFTNAGLAQLSATGDANVPEPASLAILGLAAPLFLVRRRRTA
jgi:hypothetical protein